MKHCCPLLDKTGKITNWIGINGTLLVLTEAMKSNNRLNHLYYLAFSCPENNAEWEDIGRLSTCSIDVSFGLTNVLFM